MLFSSSDNCWTCMVIHMQKYTNHNFSQICAIYLLLYFTSWSCTIPVLPFASLQSLASLIVFTLVCLNLLWMWMYGLVYVCVCGCDRDEAQNPMSLLSWAERRLGQTWGSKLAIYCSYSGIQRQTGLGLIGVKNRKWSKEQSLAPCWTAARVEANTQIDSCVPQTPFPIISPSSWQ